jgi:isocitrate dehydrogenase
MLNFHLQLSFITFFTPTNIDKYLEGRFRDWRRAYGIQVFKQGSICVQF